MVERTPYKGMTYVQIVAGEPIRSNKMASKSQLVIDTRKEIIETVKSYLYTAREIENLEAEEDFSDLEEEIDESLEKLLIRDILIRDNTK